MAKLFMLSAVGVPLFAGLVVLSAHVLVVSKWTKLFFNYYFLRLVNWNKWSSCKNWLTIHPSTLFSKSLAITHSTQYVAK